eukprot:gene4366-14489_t
MPGYTISLWLLEKCLAQCTWLLDKLYRYLIQPVAREGALAVRLAVRGMIAGLKATYLYFLVPMYRTAMALVPGTWRFISVTAWGAYNKVLLPRMTACRQVIVQSARLATDGMYWLAFKIVLPAGQKAWQLVVAAVDFLLASIQWSWSSTIPPLTKAVWRVLRSTGSWCLSHVVQPLKEVTIAFCREAFRAVQATGCAVQHVAVNICSHLVVPFFDRLAMLFLKTYHVLQQYSKWCATLAGTVLSIGRYHARLAGRQAKEIGAVSYIVFRVFGKELVVESTKLVKGQLAPCIWPAGCGLATAIFMHHAWAERRFVPFGMAAYCSAVVTLLMAAKSMRVRILTAIAKIVDSALKAFNLALINVAQLAWDHLGYPLVYHSRRVLVDLVRSIWFHPEIGLALSMGFMVAVYFAQRYGLDVALSHGLLYFGEVLWIPLKTFGSFYHQLRNLLAFTPSAVQAFFRRASNRSETDPMDSLAQVLWGTRLSFCPPSNGQPLDSETTHPLCRTMHALHQARLAWDVATVNDLFAQVSFVHSFVWLQLAHSLVLSKVVLPRVLLQQGAMGEAAVQHMVSFLARSTMKAVLGPLYLAALLSALAQVQWLQVLQRYTPVLPVVWAAYLICMWLEAFSRLEDPLAFVVQRPAARARPPTGVAGLPSRSPRLAPPQRAAGPGQAVRGLVEAGVAIYEVGRIIGFITFAPILMTGAIATGLRMGTRTGAASYPSRSPPSGGSPPGGPVSDPPAVSEPPPGSTRPAAQPAQQHVRRNQNWFWRGSQAGKGVSVEAALQEASRNVARPYPSDDCPICCEALDLTLMVRSNARGRKEGGRMAKLWRKIRKARATQDCVTDEGGAGMGEGGGRVEGQVEGHSGGGGGGGGDNASLSTVPFATSASPSFVRDGRRDSLSATPLLHTMIGSETGNPQNAQGPGPGPLSETSVQGSTRTAGSPQARLSSATSLEVQSDPKSFWKKLGKGFNKSRSRSQTASQPSSTRTASETTNENTNPARPPVGGGSGARVNSAELGTNTTSNTVTVTDTCNDSPSTSTPIGGDSLDSGLECVALCCGHVYHTECVAEWIRAAPERGRQARCPVCRELVMGASRFSNVLF